MNKECKRCLYRESHPFGLILNNKNICSGCKTHEEKETLDWEVRLDLFQSKIKEILDNYKRRSREYDCILPVRGTPEHFYLVDLVKNRLGFKPLTVSYNSQFNSHVGIENIARLRESFDIDLIQYTSNPLIYKKLIRHSIENLMSMRWPYIAGEKSFPVQIAIEKDIPLIIWTFHQPTEQVGTHSYYDDNEMTRHSRHEYDLMGYEESEATNIGSLINKHEIEDIAYPSDKKIMKHRVRGLYASNYVPWDSRKYAEAMVEKYSARAAENYRTFDTYDRIDDMTYMSIHDTIKFCKLGYSRVTDNLTREIRYGRISKSDGKLLERYYQSQWPQESIEKFLRWLGMDYKSFMWMLKRLPYYKDLASGSSERLPLHLEDYVNSYIKNTSHTDSADKFITFGKGLELDDVDQLLCRPSQ